MATTTTRVKDTPTTATTAASDDYFMVDGATNGTRKYAHNADPAAHGAQLTRIAFASNAALSALKAASTAAQETTGNVPLMSFDINVLGDSTGASQTYWVGRLATALAALFPKSAISYRPFSWENQQYSDWVQVSMGDSGPRTLSIGNSASPQGMVYSAGRSVAVQGDLWGEITYKLNNTVTDSFLYLVGNGGGANQWEFGRQLGGKPYLMITYSGQNWAVADAAPQADTDGYIHLAFTCKVNSGSFDVKFWHRIAGVWTQLGAMKTVAVSGFTGIGTSVTDYYLGGVSSTGLMPADSLIREANWGKANASKDFPLAISSFEGPPKLEAWVQPTTGISTLTGSPDIRIWNGSISGADLEHTITPNIGILTPVDSDFTIISCSHNHGPHGPSAYLGYMSQCIAALRLRCPNGDVNICTQNPQLIAFEATAGFHAQRRIACIEAARSLNVGIIDVFGAFLASANWQLSLAQGGLMQPESSDGKHPNSAGQQFWCDYVMGLIQ